MREIDTKAYLSTLREMVKEGHDVSLIISGSSMAPFLIHHRDTIIFGPIERPLKRGDMVFYERPSGQFVMHRIRWVKPEGLYLIGDAQTETEGPLDPDRVFAIVKQACRKGEWINESCKLWQFFATTWLRVIPLRRIIMKMYSFISKFFSQDRK